MRVWITDGSPVPFTDVQPLPAKHPGSIGGEVAYKGGLDENVPVGSTTVAAQDTADAFVPEAEWCVLFPNGVSRFLNEPDALNASTHVVLQGMIEGKWLNRLAGDLVWRPASLDNNLLADGPGIRTTLGDIDAGLVEGDIKVRYACRTGSRTQTASAAVLKGQNILGLVRAVLKLCRDESFLVDAVNCSARGANSALAEDPGFIARVFAAAGVTPTDLAAPSSWQKVMSEVGSVAEREGLLAVPGTLLELLVNAGESQVGKGLMRIDRVEA